MKPWRIPAHSLRCLLAMLLAACAGPSSQSPTARRTAAAAFAAEPQDRPGLGTRWGETRESRVAGARFERADARRPSAVGAVYYNDAAGIRAMAGTTRLRRDWPMLPTPAARLASVGLRDENGRFLPGLIVGDRWFVIGEEGRRYTIVVRNRSAQRLEAVLSVDGLDVLDGRKASFAKRGYVITRGGELTVDGFRRSADAVAAFRFSPVRESYANEKYGDTHNVGVIGVALFTEAGAESMPDAEARERLKANPFPAGFATPPSGAVHSEEGRSRRTDTDSF